MYSRNSTRSAPVALVAHRGDDGLRDLGMLPQHAHERFEVHEVFGCGQEVETAGRLGWLCCGGIGLALEARWKEGLRGIVALSELESVHHFCAPEEVDRVCEAVRVTFLAEFWAGARSREAKRTRINAILEMNEVDGAAGVSGELGGFVRIDSSFGGWPGDLVESGV